MESNLRLVKQSMTSNPAEENSTSKPRAFLVLRNQVFPLVREVTLIGRRLTNHLVVDDRRVSRMHAQIRIINEKFFVVDLNSTGGTFVNGQKIFQTVLYSGDQLSLAGISITFVQDSTEFENETEDYTYPNIPVEKQDQITEPRRGRG